MKVMRALAGCVLVAAVCGGQEAGVRKETAAPKVTYLGVATSPVSDTLRAQLNLPANVGLVVCFVAEGSPAEAAGLAVHDVIEKLDDQVVINPEQFSVLVTSHDPGDRINLGIVRGGDSRVIEVTLGETDEKWSGRTIKLPWSGQNVPVPDMRRQFDDWRQQFDVWQKQFREMLEQGGQRKRQAPAPGEARDGGAAADDGPADASGAAPGGAQAGRIAIQTLTPGTKHAVSSVVVTPDGQATAISSSGSSNAIVISSSASAVSTYSDGTHTITLKQDDSGKTVTATDVAGKLVFEGPINTAVERQTVPAEILEKLGKLEVQIRVSPDAVH